MDYNKLLDVWQDKVITKADKSFEKANEFKIGTKEYFKYKSYGEGLYMALSMLALEDKKAKTINSQYK